MEEKQEAVQINGERLVFVLYPFQSHINSMLQLATIMHSKGFSITIVHPKFNSPNPSNHSNFNFISISDCLSQGRGFEGDFAATIVDLNKSCEAPLQECLEILLGVGNPKDRIVGILYDTVMYFAQNVAERLKVPGITVHTAAAAGVLAFAVFPSHHEQGYVSFQDMISQELRPELQSLKLKDLLISMTDDPTDAMLELRSNSTASLNRSSAFIINTIHFLEEQTLPTVHKHFSAPTFLIGPFHKHFSVPTRESLIQEDTNCIGWLNKQAANSVIYISFGSLASMDETELVETAWGLANSGQPFLWVVRPGLVRGGSKEIELPQGFKEGVGERGCIVKWAPQSEVLGHSAVGGFWSHCGWNSTVEGVCAGVPMLCRPFFGDQAMDAKYICDVWKVGLELEGELERGKIERIIKRVMGDTAEGKEIRKRAMDFKEKAEICVREGGSSYNSLNKLIEHILKV